MKKVLIAIGYVLLGFVVFIVLYFGTEAILSRIPANSSVNSLGKKYTVYILSNDVHTDIVLPTVTDQLDWRTVFPTTHVLSQDSTYKYISIGWGDKGFYLNTPEWQDLKLKTALIAGLGIGETALHVTYYHEMHEGKLCCKVEIDENQFSILKNYILESLERDEENKSIYIETTAQYGDSDAFYEAKGAYSLFYSCNTWSNEALKKANMPSSIWTVFDKGILRHYGFSK